MAGRGLDTDSLMEDHSDPASPARLVQLSARAIEKPWGRSDLDPRFAVPATPGRPIGEIWFEPGQDGFADQLLVKYLFTGAPLSVQVHPDDGAARARGHGRGKDEAWWVMDARPGSSIGLGLVREVRREDLATAARNGAVGDLLDRVPVKAGDFLYCPAGTIHAIGAGLSLVEIQQNSDVTYRLFDYGSSRELHISSAVEVATITPLSQPAPRRMGPRTILVSSRTMVIEHWRGRARWSIDADKSSPVWIVPLKGRPSVSGRETQPATVWAGAGPLVLDVPRGAQLLLAYTGPEVRDARAIDPDES